MATSGSNIQGRFLLSLASLASIGSSFHAPPCTGLDGWQLVWRGEALGTAPHGLCHNYHPTPPQNCQRRQCSISQCLDLLLHAARGPPPTSPGHEHLKGPRTRRVLRDPRSAPALGSHRPRERCQLLPDAADARALADGQRPHNVKQSAAESSGGTFTQRARARVLCRPARHGGRPRRWPVARGERSRGL
jgi:hypothetical protein